MDYQANTAKTYLKGKDVGKFIKQNYGKELLSYTNKDLLKELDEKYNVSVNCNTLRKEAGRIRSTTKFKNSSLDAILNEGISPSNIPLDNLISLYEKNPKLAEKEFAKAKIKGARRTRYQTAKSLDMSMKQFQDYVYSSARKIMKTLIDKDELMQYVEEFEKHIKNNDLLLAYVLNEKIYESVKEKISGLNIEKIEEIIYYENLEEVSKDFEKSKIKFLETEEFTRKKNVEHLEKVVNDFKIVYSCPSVNQMNVKHISPEELKSIMRTRKDPGMVSAESDGSMKVLYTDGHRIWPTFPDAKGNIRDDTKSTFSIDDKGIIDSLKFINQYFMKLSNNYPANILFASLNQYACAIGTGNPNFEYPNFEGLVQNIAEEQEKHDIKRFFSKLGVNFN